MTKREAAIVSTYTGILIGDLNDAYAYMKEIIGRPVYTHELSNPEVLSELKSKSSKDFMSIEVV